MNVLNKFATQEKERLKQSMKNGGVFLKLSADLDTSVIVQVTDGSGIKPIETLDKEISSKIYYLFNNQNGYTGLLKDNSRLISISWFIAAYC